MNFQIKGIDNNLCKQLKLIANKEGSSLNTIFLEALKNYVKEKEIEYRRNMLNYEEDECYQYSDQ